ncbi:MAG: hypothetical protein HYT47_01425 [Candidatus Vogelbacteria bacterium]|nr:hypothetical protein [Candidatus Vogelbacteria bacterium]
MTKAVFAYLEKLRQRPEPARRRALLLVSGGLTLLVGFLWLLNLKYAGPLARSSEPMVQSAASSVGMNGVVARIRAGWQVLRDRFSN